MGSSIDPSSEINFINTFLDHSVDVMLENLCKPHLITNAFKENPAYEYSSNFCNEK